MWRTESQTRGTTDQYRDDDEEAALHGPLATAALQAPSTILTGEYTQRAPAEVSQNQQSGVGFVVLEIQDNAPSGAAKRYCSVQSTLKATRLCRAIHGVCVAPAITGAESTTFGPQTRQNPRVAYEGRKRLHVGLRRRYSKSTLREGPTNRLQWESH